MKTHKPTLSFEKITIKTGITAGAKTKADSIARGTATGDTRARRHTTSDTRTADSLK